MASTEQPIGDGASAQSTVSEGIKYWQGVNADVDGMLGGIPQVPEFAHIDKVDIQSSKNLLAKLGIGARSGLRMAENTLEGGAGYVFYCSSDSSTPVHHLALGLALG